MGTIEGVRTSSQATPGGAGRAVAAITAIPFVTVSGIAWSGDVASQAEPSDGLVGAAAMLAGLVTGLLMRRLVCTVDRRLRSVARWLLRVGFPLREVPAAARAAHPLALGTGLALRPVLLPAGVGRRGPPVLVR